jgi:hypothetical protein
MRVTFERAGESGPNSSCASWSCSLFGPASAVRLSSMRRRRWISRSCACVRVCVRVSVCVCACVRAAGVVSECARAASSTSVAALSRHPHLHTHPLPIHTLTTFFSQT